jgi:xanthine dehydrogenase accessory factor
MRPDLLRRVLAARDAGRPTALATHLASGRQALLENGAWHGDLALDAAARQAAEAALAEDRSRVVETAEGAVFVEIHNPPLRCIIVGAVHIAQPLARMTALAGYAVTIVDPRRAFASEERFPGVDLSTDWPDEALEALRPDRRTAIVTLTHDPKIDDPALVTALRSDAFYIGALGSRKTHASRCARLREQGFGDADLARIHGPIGLSIGALSPAEIAVSILAQIIATLRADRVKAREEKEGR